MSVTLFGVCPASRAGMSSESQSRPNRIAMTIRIQAHDDRTPAREACRDQVTVGGRHAADHRMKEEAEHGHPRQEERSERDRERVDHVAVDLKGQHAQPEEIGGRFDSVEEVRGDRHSTPS